jgi:two-component system, OmpR family, sensor histidine kinase PhoQ
MKSLGARLIVTLSALFVVGFGLTLAALDYSFRGLAERSRREVLEANVDALIAAAEFDRTGRLAPVNEQLSEPRLKTPGSGLVAMVRVRRGPESWRSASALGLTLRIEDDLRPGERRARLLAAPDGTRFLAFSLGVAWETSRGRGRDYVFTAAESLEPYYDQLYRLRAELLAGFVALTALLLLGVVLSLRHLLRPLRRVEAEIAEIESGRRERLGAGWPRELEGVALNLNALLRVEHDRLARYRNTVGNLAHSLKTPLSVMRGALASEAAPDRAQLEAQLDRMQDIVRHQLDRAAAASPVVGTVALKVAPALAELAAALGKVHAERGLVIAVDAPAELAYPLERGDFLEIAGNLADNACKWARHEVRIAASAWLDAGWRRAGLVLAVSDDGPGIPADERARVRGRGVRLDERVPGQGLGLAMVDEIVKAYGGSFELGASAAGGLTAVARLPGA